jgi:hypothetical protein
MAPEKRTSERERLDREIAAMRQLDTQLQAFPLLGQGRIIAWLSGRYRARLAARAALAPGEVSSS